MFVEAKKEAKGRIASRLEDSARRYPRTFTAALVILAVFVTIGLLFKTGYTLVLYQGF
jgi:hypothetical protein